MNHPPPPPSPPPPPPSPRPPSLVPPPSPPPLPPPPPPRPTHHGQSSIHDNHAIHVCSELLPSPIPGHPLIDDLHGIKSKNKRPCIQRCRIQGKARVGRGGRRCTARRRTARVIVFHPSPSRLAPNCVDLYVRCFVFVSGSM